MTAFLRAAHGHGRGLNAVLDTRGADRLVAGGLLSGSGGRAFVDSLNNTWLPVLELGAGDPGDFSIGVYFCDNPVTGATHTFSATTPIAQFQVIAFAGAAGTPMLTPASNRPFINQTAAAVGPVETTVDFDMLVLFSTDTGQVMAPSGMTVAERTPGVSGQHYGGTAAFAIAPAGSTFSTSVTWPNPERPHFILAGWRGLGTAPGIGTQPSPQVVTAGQAATFSVTATGTGPFTYQWRRNGVEIAGATAASYTTPATVLGDNGAQFTVRVANAAGNVLSAAATLTVNAAPPPPTGSVTTMSPSGQTVTVSGTFSNQVSSASATLAPDSPANGAIAQGPMGVTLGAGTWSVTFAAVPTGRYLGPAVTLSGPGGAVVLTGAAFEILGANGQPEAPGPAPAAPAITTQPAAQSVTAPAGATFTVAATGTQPLAYQWRRNGVAVAGATQSSYTLSATAVSDSGASFDVVVSNGAGSVASLPAVLTVSAAAVAPAITTHPAAQSVTAPAGATFTVAATGTQPLAYQWRRNGVAVAGATQSSYTLSATAVSDSGASFDVVVSNGAGSVASLPAVLTVSAAAVAPAITTQPAAQSVTAPAGATFAVVATGTPPLAYQWRRNGVAIPGATQGAYLLPSTVVGDSGTSFDVVVSNSAGSVASSSALLTVAAAPLPPTGGTITSSRLERGNTQAHMGKPFRAFVHVEATGELLFVKTGLTTSQLGQVAFQDGRLSAGQLYAVRWKRDDTGEQGFELLRAS